MDFSILESTHPAVELPSGVVIGSKRNVQPNLNSPEVQELIKIAKTVGLMRLAWEQSLSEEELISEKVNCINRGGSESKKDSLVQNVISKSGGSPSKSINKRLQSALKLAENIISDSTVQRLVIEGLKEKSKFDGRQGSSPVVESSNNHPTDGTRPKVDPGTKETFHADGSKEGVLFSSHSPTGMNRFKQADLNQVSKSQLFRSKRTEKQMSVESGSAESLPSKKNSTKPTSISKDSEVRRI